ncbi:hypothetical protein [Streptomyces sp. NPDC057115]|uniref:hypothetical protein n=1 Tax=Streptomyces sp. NPDC057115 TaxID=3346022 RepID=UPI00364566DE
MRTTATTITLAAALLLTATACTADDEPSGSGPSTPAPATTSAPPSSPAEPSGGTGDGANAVEKAVQDYTRAYFAGEASTAHGMLSERCRKEINPLLFGETVRQASKEHGPDHPATDVRAEVSGDLARVSYKVKGLPSLDQAQQPWAREGGAWKYDAC